MVEKILNNTTPYGKNGASYEGSLHSSTLKCFEKLVFHDGLCKHFKWRYLGMNFLLRMERSSKTT